jgi:hypothetical protein
MVPVPVTSIIMVLDVVAVEPEGLYVATRGRTTLSIDCDTVVIAPAIPAARPTR